ncbi:MAG: glycoside hydrolase family 127 protein [Anaerolineae bacterium]|nr:glycoside hydrolase family 127 protein [Anaerolineae bacterium]
MEQPYVPNRAPLLPLAFSFLPLGAVKPRGWLRNQLQIQANGLSGHLDEFWPDLGPNNGWLGGSGEAWERGPYFLDGLVPLAYLLDDRRLMAKAQKWLDWVLDHQHENGWLGPIRDMRRPYYQPYDKWPASVMLKALTQYQEATGDPRVIPAMTRCFAFVRDTLDEYPLYSWAIYRWADLVLSVFWLYNRTGDAWLLDLARRIQQQGYNWAGHFSHFRYLGRQMEGYDLRSHVVNNAMGIKTPGVWFQLSRAEEDRQSVYEALANLDRYHGQVTGVFGGDEHLAGPDPSQGTELCAVVEYLFSLENLISILGDPAMADRLERIAYNALPATFSPDMWAHQYDQQVNQVLCTLAKRNWTTNGDESNLFGLEPGYGCCTSNMHQGWPKFASSLWMATPEGGLAAIAYAPSEVKVTAHSGRQMTIIEETDYPFGEVVRFTVQAAESVAFPLTLRAPSWCDEATVRFADGTTRPLPAGTFQTVERRWQPGETLTLTLPMEVKAQKRYHDAVALARGPLVFSLKIGEEWRYLRGEKPHADWEVLPTTPWNYGLMVDREHPERSVTVITRPVGEMPFSPEGAPVLLKVKGRHVPGWTLVQNSAGPLPQSPVRSNEPVEQLTLIPYGSSNLRVSEFPEIAE